MRVRLNNLPSYYDGYGQETGGETGYELAPYAITGPKGVLLYLQTAAALDRGTVEALLQSIEEEIAGENEGVIEASRVVKSDTFYYGELLVWADDLDDPELMAGGVVEKDQLVIRLATEEDLKTKMPKWLVPVGIGVGLVSIGGIVAAIVWAKK